MSTIYKTRDYLLDLDCAIVDAGNGQDANTVQACQDMKQLFEEAHSYVRETEEQSGARYMSNLQNSAALLKVLMSYDDVKEFIDSTDGIDMEQLQIAIDSVYQDSFSNSMNYAAGAGFLSSNFSDTASTVLNGYQKPECGETPNYSPVEFFKVLLDNQITGFHRHSDKFHNSGVTHESIGF